MKTKLIQKIEKECKGCGISFYPINPQTLYHSVNCKGKFHDRKRRKNPIRVKYIRDYNKSHPYLWFNWWKKKHPKAERRYTQSQVDKMLEKAISQSKEDKDYIVVESYEVADDLIKNYKGKSLQGKWIVVAPRGIKEISIDELLKLPQIKEIVSQTKQELIEEKQKKIKNYNFKKHLCRFNDGKQNCECYIEGLNTSIKLLEDLDNKK